jgi:hypothetical protein
LGWGWVVRSIESIQKLLEEVAWTPLPHPMLPTGGDPDVPYATHEGQLAFGDARLRVYLLNDGERIINADDLAAFLADDGPRIDS